MNGTESSIGIWPRGRRKDFALACVVFLLICACNGNGGGDGIMSPPPSLNLTGRWSGHGNDSSGPGTFTWILTHSGTSISGTVELEIPGFGTGSGTVSGNLAGSTLNFTITIPMGGFPNPFGACTATVNGVASDVTNTRISGTYSGTNSCTGPVTNGQLDLMKM